MPPISDFPILGRQIYGRPLVYLDNAATTQKPRQVVEAIENQYYNVNANVHRGVHFLSQQATELHEQARDTVRQFIGAASIEEVIFTRGTTESLNLLASCLSRILQGREVLVSVMEHHSNIVPWQLNGFKVVPFRDIEHLSTLLSDRTALVSVAHISNVLGVANPVSDIVAIAHQHGVPVVVDAAQSVPHVKVDVQSLGCDFLAFSGHKVYGPTGIGVLYGRKEWLDRMPPYQGGGEMIDHVTFEHTTFNALPYKFEAGTPDYVGSHALAVALQYVTSIGIEAISDYETKLGCYLVEQLRTIPNITIYDNPHGAVVSFNLSAQNGTPIHHLDVGTLLDRLGVAVRTGHHCAEPLMRHLGIEGTVRASIALYTTQSDIDTLINSLLRIQSMF